MKSNKPSDDLDYPINYLSEQTGGSLRHKNIRAVDCQRALFNLARDWRNYYENQILISVAEARREALEQMDDAAIQALAALESADPHSYQNSLVKEKAIEKLKAIRALASRGEGGKK